MSTRELCNRIRYVLEEYGVDGIYTDSTHVPWACANVNHGCGYTDENGVLHSTYPIWALRHHSKAMYETIHSKEGSINQTHNSSCLVAPTIGFSDYLLNGESIADSVRQRFSEFLNLPAFRSEFMGHNVGIPCQMLAFTNQQTDIEKYTSLCIIHDILPVGKPKDVEYLSKFWTELSSFDSGNALWHPYWKKNSPVYVETPDSFCSIYEKDGQYLAAVSSFNENTNEVVLHFDSDVEVLYDVLGLNATISAGKTVTLKMDSYKPNLIRIKKR